MLRSKLGNALWRERPCVRRLGCRPHLRLSIDRRRRRVDDAPIKGLTGCRKQSLSCKNVVARIGDKAGAPARPHARFGGEVENHVAVSQYPSYIILRKIRFNELERLAVAQRLNVALLEFTAVVVRK